MSYKMIKSVSILVLAVIFTALSGCKTGEKARLTNLQTEGEFSSGAIIQSITFVDKGKFSNKTLKKKLDFKVGDNFDSVLIESGRYELSEFYRKKGYAEVKVTLDNSELVHGRVAYIIDKGTRYKIKSVKFKGNKLIKTGNLRSIIKTKTNEWFFWSSYYTEEKIASDVKRLKDAYYQRGFLNYDIQVLGRSDITFLIDEGPRYKINKIEVTGNKEFDNETLLSKFELETGSIYYPLKAKAQAERILNMYREKGYVEVNIKYEHSFTEVGNNTVDINFDITEGIKFRIGRVEIIGNEQTQDKVIRNVLEEYKFSPGQLYNANMAPPEGGGELESRVRGATLAEEVSITPVISEPNQESDMLDATVSITEGLTGMWNPGIAYGTDDGFVGMLSWSQGNFDITDWPESFGEFITMQSFKGAGQRLSVNLRPGKEISSYSVSLTEPYFRNKPISLNVAGQSWERWYSSHDEKRTKGTFSFQKRYRSLWRTNFGFRVENVDVGGIEYDAPQEIIDFKGNNLLIGTKFGFGRDETDDMYLPSSGYVFNFDYEHVTGDDDFGILEGYGVFYKTLYKDFRDRKTILAAKLLAGTISSNAPFYEKFYAGGIGNYGIRGFEYRGISDRALPNYDYPIGSDSIFLANAEVSVPLIGDNVSLLFFVDIGTVNTGPYRISAGGGLQVMVPQFLGPVPIRFTFAEPIRKDDYDETQSFSFFMGGMFPY
ncbi:MAG: BamA/TamA family outer membrane protein [Sedimentisphaerales bacterium]|nr:BamA/TamA family outer membrane protein [Sedimentisphaerales bacterium]